MSNTPTEPVETIAEEKTPSKIWAESVDEAMGGAGIKSKPTQIHHSSYKKKKKAYEESLERRSHIVQSLESFHENGGFELVAHEIEIQEQFKRGQLSEKEIGRIIRGHVFENISLHLLSIEGTPVNPTASQKLANIVRFPHKFIDEVQQVLEENEIEIKGQVAKNLESAREQLKKHPRNNDAIAFNITEDDDVVMAEITGSFEMKNYMLGTADKVESVRKQLEDAAEDTREVIRVLNETNLYSAYAMLKTIPGLPHIISMVPEKDFLQTVVQPQGMFQGDLRESSEKQKKRYEKGFNEQRDRQLKRYEFSYVGVSNRELELIYEKVDKDIREYLKTRKKS
jgi:hypothetical protein